MRMAWVILFVAGLFEVRLVMGLSFSEGFTRLPPSLLTVVSGHQLLPALGGDAGHPRGHGVRGLDGDRGRRRGAPGALFAGRAGERAAYGGDRGGPRRRGDAEARRGMRRLVVDELWKSSSRCCHRSRRNRRTAGRPRVPDRCSALEGTPLVVYVLKSGAPWRMNALQGVRVQRRDLLATVARLAECGRVARRLSPRGDQQECHPRVHLITVLVFRGF
jgi:hypothetical protein